MDEINADASADGVWRSLFVTAYTMDQLAAIETPLASAENGLPRLGAAIDNLLAGYVTDVNDPLKSARLDAAVQRAGLTPPTLQGMGQPGNGVPPGAGAGGGMGGGMGQ